MLQLSFDTFLQKRDSFFAFAFSPFCLSVPILFGHLVHDLTFVQLRGFSVYSCLLSVKKKNRRGKSSS